jgi:hypothetical protein
MSHILIEEAEIRKMISDAVETWIARALPYVVRLATQKTHLTRDEVKALTGWSTRTLQYLRSKRLIPFVQDGRKILYPAEGLEAFLQERHIAKRR